jgi:hypothetical protein
MEEKKGLNFLVGIFVIWLIYKLYTLGILHTIGFMTFNYATGSELVYSPNSYTVTPLATFVSLIIESITILGYLSVIVSSGIWSIIVTSSGYLNDLFRTVSVYLKDYSQNFKKTNTTTVKVEDTTVKPPVDDKTMLFATLKEIVDRLNTLENKQSLEKNNENETPSS